MSRLSQVRLVGRRARQDIQQNRERLGAPPPFGEEEVSNRYADRFTGIASEAGGAIGDPLRSAKAGLAEQ